MNDELRSSSPEDDARDVWQQQSGQPYTVSAEAIQQKIRKYHRGLLIGVGISAAACLVVIVSFVFILRNVHSGLERVGAILIVLGAAYILNQLVQLWRQKRAAVATPGGSARASIDFFRAALERQRDFHSGRIFWSRMAAFSPGIVIFMVGTIRANPGDRSAIYVAIAMIALMAAAIPLNLGSARMFQKQIDALNASNRSNDDRHHA